MTKGVCGYDTLDFYFFTCQMTWTKRPFFSDGSKEGGARINKDDSEV